MANIYSPIDGAFWLCAFDKKVIGEIQEVKEDYPNNILKIYFVPFLNCENLNYKYIDTMTHLFKDEYGNKAYKEYLHLILIDRHFDINIETTKGTRIEYIYQYEFDEPFITGEPEWKTKYLKNGVNNNN